MRSKDFMGNQRKRVTCTPATWWAMDERLAVEICTSCASPQILALIVFFLNLRLRCILANFGEVIRLNDTILSLSSSSSSSGAMGSGPPAEGVDGWAQRRA
jgi:hypothetical protein